MRFLFFSYNQYIFIICWYIEFLIYIIECNYYFLSLQLKFFIETLTVPTYSFVLRQKMLHPAAN